MGGGTSAIICILVLLSGILCYHLGVIQLVESTLVHEINKSDSNDGTIMKTKDKIMTLEDLQIPVKLEVFINDTRKPRDGLAEIAKETYPRIIDCLKNSPHAREFQFDQIHFPSDAEKHYEDLLNKTKIFRNIYM